MITGMRRRRRDGRNRNRRIMRMERRGDVEVLGGGRGRLHGCEHATGREEYDEGLRCGLHGRSPCVRDAGGGRGGTIVPTVTASRRKYFAATACTRSAVTAWTASGKRFTCAHPPGPCAAPRISQ